MAAPTPRPGILDIKPYVGGEGRGASSDQPPVRLASNENILGFSAKAHEAYLRAASELHRYPDGNVSALRLALGRKFGLDAEKIVCGNGSEELIMQIIRAYAGVGDEVVYSQYGFLMYPIQIRAAGAKPVAAPESNMRTDIDAVLKAVTPKTKIVILANPNNPTGSYLTRDEMNGLRSRLREDVLLVIDSAYAEFVDGADYDDGAPLVSSTKNTVMLRTFSKLYGLAALRLGWGYFPTEVADVLNRIRGTFNVSLPAQMAGVAALEDDEFVSKTLEAVAAGRRMLSKGLEKMGLLVYPSSANFLLVEFGDHAEQVRLALKEQNIFIRQMNAYNLPKHLRISVGLEADNDRLLTEIGKIIQ